MEMPSNMSDLDLATETKELKLYSIVLSTTMLVLAILFGGGGCLTVLIAMGIHRLHRKLRYILLGVLLAVCTLYDLVWCPLEIARLLIHQHNVLIRKNVSTDETENLKNISDALYIILLCSLASMLIIISVQNLLKMIKKYDFIPKIKLGSLFLFIWLCISIILTVIYLLNHKSLFQFRKGVQILWLILVLVFMSLMVTIHYYCKYWRNHMVSEMSDLHSTDNFTVPSLIIKSVEEIDDEDIDDSSIALPSPDIVKDSSGNGNDSPTSRTSRSSKCSKSALKKQSGSPSSQKVGFVEAPSPARENPSPRFGEKIKSNHLEVNMAAILGRRRHTIAQISDPKLDMMNKAKNYNYVRKFSVDISALQAQLENPKITNSYPFHSQQDIKNSGSDRKISNTGSQQSCNRRSRDELLASQEIREEPEIESEDERGNGGTSNQGEQADSTSVHSQCPSAASRHSARDSICPTPPLISLTQSDGEEKALEPGEGDHGDGGDSCPSSQCAHRHARPCKLACLLLLTFLACVLPMLITDLLWNVWLSDGAYINTITCMTAISMAQTMIFPQVIFCVDSNINKAVNYSFAKARVCIMSFLHQKQAVPTNDDISDTEV